ncbi:MAG: hypothetical protein GY820_44155 [Gammaproteobacteria bacterium]|nr:hypothetical protein [Gammaproteobacteria bacterium]
MKRLRGKMIAVGKTWTTSVGFNFKEIAGTVCDFFARFRASRECAEGECLRPSI